MKGQKGLNRPFLFFKARVSVVGSYLGTSAIAATTDHAKLILNMLLLLPCLFNV